MPINKETLNKRLHKALSRYDAKPVDEKNEVVPLADEAQGFRFNFVKAGENYGVVYATLDDTNSLTVWYDDDVMDSPNTPTSGMDYDDSFTGLLEYMKKWAMNNQLSFKTDNKDHLGNEMARRKRMKEKENVSEGYYPIGKKASYSDAVPSVKIILQHTKVMQEGEQRFRHIEKIFVENVQGERFLLPTNKPGLARVFARHIAEGGTPYDERAGHIQSLVEEYSKMAGFVRATRNGQFNESAQQLVQEGVNHYMSLRESLNKMTGHRGYTAYFENWTPALMEDETDTNNINELFVQETLDPRIESVMPILSRLHKQVSEMKEIDALSEWADEIISEKMVMGADSDASSSGTIFVEDDIDEATDLKSIPDEGIEESGLQAYLGNKKYGKEGMNALRKAGQEHSSKEKMAKIRAKYDKLDEVDMEEGLGDIAKKVGGAVKKAAGKALDYVAPGDEELLRQLQKNAGVRGTNHGKPSMAHSEVEKRTDEEVAEDLDANQKRVGQLGPTEKVGKKGAVGKLVGANESFINTTAQAVTTEEGMAEGMDYVRKRRLYDLIELYRDATEPNDYYDRDIEDPEEVIAMIRKEFGDKIANQVDSGADKMHFPRHNIQGIDPLKGNRPVDRITKAGKMYKQDMDYKKRNIKSRLGIDEQESVAEAFGPLPQENQKIRLGRHTVDIERVGLNKNYIGFAWHDSKGQEHYEEVAVGDLSNYDDLIARIKDEIKHQERQYTDQGVAEGSVSKEKQKTPYRDINSPEYQAAADKQKQQMTKDKAAEPGKKLADKIANKGVAEGLNEMDKSQPSSGRGGESSGDPYAKGGKGTFITPKKMASDAKKALDKAMDKAHKKDVKEGQEDLDAILRIIRK